VDLETRGGARHGLGSCSLESLCPISADLCHSCSGAMTSSPPYISGLLGGLGWLTSGRRLVPCSQGFNSECFTGGLGPKLTDGSSLTNGWYVENEMMLLHAGMPFFIDSGQLAKNYTPTKSKTLCRKCSSTAELCSPLVWKVSMKQQWVV
jgi:hypothetical protein